MQQFIRFGLVGALSTILDMAVLKVLLLAHVPLLIAGAIGFFVGFSNGYYFNSRYVFSRGSRTQYVRYLLVSMWGLVLTEIILYLAHHEMGIAEMYSKLIAVVIVFFSNYLLSKTWAFR